MSARRWPWPADGPVDAAQRIALAYRHRLQQVDAEGAESLDNFWADLGATWVLDTKAPEREDDWLTAPEAAELFGINRQRLYNWAGRGHVEHEVICGVRRYRVGSIRSYLTHRHQLALAGRHRH